MFLCVNFEPFKGLPLKFCAMLIISKMLKLVKVEKRGQKWRNFLLMFFLPKLAIYF